MKEYIKKFNDFSSADLYKIRDIPWIGTAVKTDGHINLRTTESNRIIVESGDTLVLVTMLEITGGTWDGSGSDNRTRVFISGDVTLTGKTDCYSITFEEGGHLTINAGARLRVWQGGITNNDCTTVNYLTIVEDSVNDLYGEFLLHPDVSVNNHPLVIVNMSTYCKQTGANPYTYTYQRLTIPIISTGRPQIDFSGELFPGESSFENYAWTWNGTKWVGIGGWGELKPFKGYEFANNSKNGGVIYSFSDALIGNIDAEFNFPTGGYEVVGNSYLAHISIQVLFSIIKNTNIDKVYIFKNVGDSIESIEITQENISQYPYIFPLASFIFHTTGSSGTKVTLSYHDLIWNPSFEEEVTPTRSLMKSVSSKPSEIDTTLEGSGIFDNPESPFPPEHIE